MRKILVSVGVGLLGVAVWGTLAWAQAELPVIPEQSQGEVRFMSGGVGGEERAVMDSRAKEYNLKLVFALTTREYLSDVKVVIQDSAGKTHLSATTDGPWMLVKLPETDCVIQASIGEKKVVEKRKVGKGLQTVHFLFKP
jgi:hypothetical protein